MDTKYIKPLFARAMHVIVILVVVFSAGLTAYAAPLSPFAGHWQAIDVDGSDIRLSIGGPSSGPFQITWTESYISFCGGEAGIVRGTGMLSVEDVNLLEADLHLECFETGVSLDFHLSFRYHPATNTLSTRYDSGNVTIWHRPGGGQAQEPPALGLRVNYGHDWVESFYEAGHTAWITVTESDGVTVKATAELVTEPKDFWGGETGFQTQPENWKPGPPDIQSYDWVYGWVDNGASAQVQIGDIGGTIDLNADSIEGTIYAPWFSDQQMQVDVECFPWGSPKPIDNVTYGMVLPDNAATYSCSWSGQWNILPYQDVGVGYFGPDGHWVANAIYASAPQIIASESGDWFWTTGFAQGPLNLVIYESSDEGAALLWQDNQDADESGFVSVGYEDHGQDLVEGNYLVVSDGVNQKELVLLQTTVTVFDTINEIMAGVAPAGSEVWAAAGPMEWQQRIFVEADPDTGEWLANFAEIGFDITEDMRPSSFSHVYDGDGDANEGSTPPPMGLRVNYGHDWVESFYEAGHQVLVTLTDLDGNIKATATAVTEPKWYWGDEPGFQTLDAVWLDGEENQLESPPDIQPNDWVIAQVDNGVTAQVQIGDIQGEVRIDLDSVTGTIEVPWLTEPVPVECLDWGSGGEPVNKDAGFVYPDGASPYSCSWDPETEWDVQPWQDIGVGYSTPDGHWVANAFRDERWMAFWTYDPPASLFGKGEHSYFYEWAYTTPLSDSGTSGPRTITIEEDPTPIYDGYALIGPWGWDYPGNLRPQQVRTGSTCEGVSVLHPDQPMRFVWGWVNDYSMTYEEALAHFTSFAIEVSWDFFSDGTTDGSGTLTTMTDLLPFMGQDARFEYLCTFTEHP